jgi:hypothetical protein
VLTCAVSFSVDAIGVQLFARLGLNHLTIYPSNYKEYSAWSLKKPTDCFHKIHEFY